MTQIALTFDIEFDINGAFAHPLNRTPRGIESLLGGVDGSLGLRRILSILERFNFRATFFIEALQTVWFGFDEMARAIDLITAGGHEVQLHLHPVWLLFEDDDWQHRVLSKPPIPEIDDSLCGRPAEVSRAIVQRGIAAFSEWGLKPPSAVRTGSLFIESSLYPVFQECGVALSSSVGVGLSPPSESDLCVFHSPRSFHGVLELPVSSYVGADRYLRSSTRLATLIGMGKWELSALLKAALENSLPFIVMLSHVSEFYSTRRQSGGGHNDTTEQKLIHLCKFVRDSRDLDDATISELAVAAETVCAASDSLLSVSRAVSFSRFFNC